MPSLTPVSRRELIQRQKRLGFEGPYTGGRHQFMLREDRRLILPNPHRGDISVDLLFGFCDGQVSQGKNGSPRCEASMTGITIRFDGFAHALLHRRVQPQWTARDW